MDKKNGDEMRLDMEQTRFKKLDIFVRCGEIKLGEVANVIGGASNISPKTNHKDVYLGKYPLMMVADLAKNHIDYYLNNSVYKLNEKAVKDKRPHLFPKNTILIPTTGKASLKNHRALLAIESYATSTLTGIETRQNGIHPYCLFRFFLNFNVERITYDLGYPGITPPIIKSIPIPNYTEQQQHNIISEIEEAVDLSRRLKEKHKEIKTRDSLTCKRNKQRT